MVHDDTRISDPAYLRTITETILSTAYLSNSILPFQLTRKYILSVIQAGQWLATVLVNPDMVIEAVSRELLRHTEWPTQNTVSFKLSPETLRVVFAGFERGVLLRNFRQGPQVVFENRLSKGEKEGHCASSHDRSVTTGPDGLSDSLTSRGDGSCYRTTTPSHQASLDLGEFTEN
jgi:hypothetical protein